MRLRAILLLVLLLLPALAGCVQRVEERLRGEADVLHPPDPRRFRFFETNVTITASDGVPLRATFFAPQPLDPADRFPVVIFMHGWGGSRLGSASMGEVMRAFAREGYAVVAYDARGFGESGGASTLAGPREMQDLREVLDWAVNATAWNGRAGVTGGSYGGAHAYWALVHDERVTTAVPHYGWIDLADGLLPGGVPKQWWIATLLLIAAQGGAQYDPVLNQWAAEAVRRENVSAIRAELRARSVARDLGNVTKPVLLVEGTRETLFPQAFDAYARLENASARKLFVYEGGHGTFDADAWKRTRLWFDRWLKLEDTGVEDWPAVSVQTPWDGARRAFAGFPVPGTRVVPLHLADDTPADGEGSLADEPGSPAAGRFAGSARSGLLDDPSVLRDAYGARGAQQPTRLRGAPGEAMIFRGAPLDRDVLLLGAPLLHLTLRAPQPGMQVVARLYDEAPDGTSALLSRGSLDPSPLASERAVEIPLDRALARLEAGHRLVLVVAGDDASHTSPYPLPFTAEVLVGGDAGSRLLVPLADP